MNTLFFITVLISAMVVTINATPTSKSSSLAEILQQYQLANSMTEDMDVDDDGEDDDGAGNDDVAEMIMHVMATAMFEPDVYALQQNNAKIQKWFKNIIKRGRNLLKSPLGRFVSSHVKKRICSSK